MENVSQKRTQWWWGVCQTVPIQRRCPGWFQLFFRFSNTLPSTPNKRVQYWPAKQYWEAKCWEAKMRRWTTFRLALSLIHSWSYTWKEHIAKYWGAKCWAAKLLFRKGLVHSGGNTGKPNTWNQHSHGKQNYFSGRASSTQEARLGSKILGSNTGKQNYFSGRASSTQEAILGSKILGSSTGKQNYFLKGTPPAKQMTCKNPSCY